jgi:hypothetical protein
MTMCIKPTGYGKTTDAEKRAIEKRAAAMEALPLGSRVWLASDGRTGTIDDVAIIDGVPKYRVVSDTSADWVGWFYVWDIEHV